MPSTTQIPILEPTEPVERTIPENQTHSYALDLQAGDYVYVVAEQLGVDIALRLVNPVGTELAQVDSPTGTLGKERLWEIAETPGRHRLEVLHVGGGGDDASYELRLLAQRPADDRDRLRVQAFRAFQRGEEQRRRGEPAEALPHYERALENWREVGEQAEQATTHFRLGYMNQLLGNPDRALEHYETAREIFEELGQRHELASLLMLLSQLEEDALRLSESLDHARQAAGIFEELDDLPAAADAQFWLGRVCRKLYRLEESMMAHERALELWEQLDAPRNQALAHFEIGRLYVFRSDQLATRHHFERARELAQAAGDQKLASGVERRLSDVAEDRTREILEGLTHELATLRRDGAPADVLWLLHSLGTRLREAGDLSTARAYLQEGVEMSRARDLVLWEAEMVHALGRIAHVDGRHEVARTLQAEAASLHGQAGNSQGVVSSRFAEARALYHLGRFEEAREILEDLLTGVEDLRIATESHTLRASYVAARRHYWELYVQTLMRLHEQDPEARFDLLALEASERARGRSLLDLLQEASFHVRDAAAVELLGKQERILKHLSRLEAGSAGMPPEELDRQRTSLQLELEDLDRRLRKNHPHYEEMRAAEPPPLGEILALLPTNIQILVYFLAEDQSFVWSLGADGVAASHVLPGRSEIEGPVRALMDNLPRVQGQAMERRPNLAQEVSELLLAPVTGQLETEHLVVIPDGVLHVLPFAALPLPDQNPSSETVLVVDRLSVSSSPSLSTLSFLAQRERSPSQPMDRVAIFADPVFTRDDERVSSGRDSPTGAPPEVPEPVLRSARRLGLEDFPRLDDSGREARDLAELAKDRGLQVDMYLGHEANRSHFQAAQSQRYRVLHFATHALPNEVHPEFSSLLLSLVDEQGRPREGHVRLHELYNLDLPANLVVLSACRTGRGQELRGEGVVGLARGFFYAGASRVLHSLWSVDDEGTAELMTRFYRYFLKEGKPAAQALRLAQLSMRKSRWDAPLYWAGFMLQGLPDLSDEPPIEKTLTVEPEPNPDPDPGDLPGTGGTSA